MQVPTDVLAALQSQQVRDCVKELRTTRCSFPAPNAADADAAVHASSLRARAPKKKQKNSAASATCACSRTSTTARRR
jgi:hypothetical protein